jgi:hypothetical protein
MTIPLLSIRNNRQASENGEIIVQYLQTTDSGYFLNYTTKKL